MSRGIGKGKLVALGVVGIALAGLLTPVRPEISPMSPKAKPTPIDLGALHPFTQSCFRQIEILCDLPDRAIADLAETNCFCLETCVELPSFPCHR